MQTRLIDNSLRKTSKEDRTAEFIISDSTIDRHGTILDTNWDVEKYKLNPIVGYMHQVYGKGFFDSGDDNPDTIIGTSEVFFDDNKLIGKVLFEPKEINPLAEKIYQKVLFGTLRAASVGFIPVEEGEDEKMTIDGQEKDVFKFGKRELLEWSIVKVPSNPNAVKRKFEDIQGRYDLMKSVVDERPDPNEHSCRIREADQFDSDTFRRTTKGKALLSGAGILTIPETISIIWSKLKTANKPADQPLVQALRFPKTNWTEGEAKKWLSDNKVDYIAFEAASESSKLYFLKKKLEIAEKS